MGSSKERRGKEAEVSAVGTNLIPKTARGSVSRVGKEKKEEGHSCTETTRRFKNSEIKKKTQDCGGKKKDLGDS